MRIKRKQIGRTAKMEEGSHKRRDSSRDEEKTKKVSYVPPVEEGTEPDQEAILDLDQTVEKRNSGFRSQDPMVGKSIDGRYVLHERIGMGGMGSVYRATHMLMDKPVAIKLISAELAHLPQVVGRFEREARSASRLSHPNCITVTDFGRTEDGTLYLVMELLDGEALDELLARDITLPAYRVIELTKQILRGLIQAHEAGIVHRDLKPANVMLVKQDDGSDFAKVFDFGIAKIADAAETDHRLTQQGMIVGTPAYLSPEQALGEEADNRSDLYAVGIMVYEMLTGEVPFIGDVALDVVTAHINAPVPPLPSTVAYPIGLREIIEKALAKKSVDRFQSAAELLAAMEALDDKRLEKGGLPQRRSKTKGSHFGVALLLTVLLAAAATAVLAKYYLGRLELKDKRETLSATDTQADPNEALYPGVGEKKVADLLNQAEEQIKNSLYDDAIATIKKTLIIAPEQPIARLLLGHAMFVSNKRAEAMDAYEQALRADRTLVSDERLMTYLETGLEHDASRDKAVQLLAEFGGEKGLSILTARANSKLSTHRKQRAVARNALIKMKRDDVIDWVATLSADFDDYKLCKKRKEIIADMTARKDPGFLPFLEAQAPPNGHWNKSLKCYKEDVERAIRTLKEVEHLRKAGGTGMSGGKPK